MKPRFFFLALGLVAVLLTASCAPAAPVAPIEASPLATVPVPATSAPADTSMPEATAPAPTQTVEVEVQAVPTSRGTKLEATDPASVSLASGQLQLVEFFRFT